MQCVVIRFFRFSGLQKLWILPQMQFGLKGLRKGPHAPGFMKLMGSGGEGGFSAKPGFDVYAFLGVWNDEESARKYFAENQKIQALNRRSKEQWSVFLRPVKASGFWSEQQPFKPGGVTHPDHLPIAVITRASIKRSFLFRFWRDVPKVSAVLNKAEGRLFSIGIGEWPWLEQATFSVWHSKHEMLQFAYHSAAHREAIKHTQQLKWYSEELFAQFLPYKTEGSWQGIENPFGTELSRANHHLLNTSERSTQEGTDTKGCPFH